MKKLIIFDLDGSLTESKEVITHDMARLLSTLLSQTPVAIISGAAHEQFKTQLLPYLTCTDTFANLYLLPTSGSHLLEYQDHTWQTIYHDTIAVIERERITKILQSAIARVPHAKPPHTYGPQIEDRESQITFSGLGQNAPIELKRVWDPDKKIRKDIIAHLQNALPEYDIKIGGSTSIDITKKDRDKAYGVRRLLEHLFLGKGDALFIGDRIIPGGNDYSVKEFGVECIQVSGPEETKKVIQKLVEE